MATIFAPQVRPVQPAFINNGGGVKVYFSLSSFNKRSEIGSVKYSLIDPNIASTWGSNVKSEGTISTISTEGSEYYITIPTAGLNLVSNQFYQVQIWLVDATNSSNISDPSQATLVRPINSHTITLPSGDQYELNIISGSISDSIELLANISCKINGYVYNGKCNGQTFTIDMSEYPFAEGTAYTLEFTYETLHGYKSIQSKNCTLKAPTSYTGLVLTQIWADAAAASINIAYTGGQANDIIERASEEDSWTTWKKIGQLGATSKTVAAPWRDCTVQSEVRYKYRVTRMNGSTKQAQMLTTSGTSLSVPFEHVIISDKDFLLNLKYNVNISGFKYVNQESVTNTLGGRYPLIRRNGDTNYIQFSLSGMLYVDCTNIDIDSVDSRGNGTDSFLEDDRAILYLNDSNKIGFTQSDNQMLIERRVREIITRLLTNGRPKLFRSFEEGNMIVYLSGISFTPNKQLGRHIYDFSATVTQLCDYTFNNLNKYNLNQNYYVGFMQSIGLEDPVVNSVFYDGSVTIEQEE